MVFEVCLIVITIAVCLIGIIIAWRSSVRNKLVMYDGAVPVHRSKGNIIKRNKARRSSLPPKVEPTIDEQQLERLADKVASKIKLPEVIATEALVDKKVNEKVESHVISIDESLVDLGVDIQNVKSDGIKTKKETKKDDLGKMKAKLSRLKRKKRTKKQ